MVGVFINFHLNKNLINKNKIKVKHNPKKNNQKWNLKIIKIKLMAYDNL